MKKVVNIFALSFIISSIISFIGFAQNTPTNAKHLLSLTEGISAPYRIAVNSDGTIYVTDIVQKNVVKYDKSFNYIGSFKVGIKPSAIAINSSDDVFIGDGTTGIIYKLDSEENPTVFSNIINTASSMIFGNDNFLYVVDNKLRQITVLDQSGNFVRSIGAGLFIQPIAITYDSKNDRIFVAEHGGIGEDIGWFNGYPLTKIWIFDTEGNELSEIGEGGSDDGEFYRIQGMAISRTGTVYVTDPYQAGINIFEEDGTFISKFGEYGSTIGQLNIPMDVKFDYQGRTLVTSLNTGAIEVYYVNEINPTFEISATKNTICPGETTDLKIDFTGTAPWTFTYTKDGINPVTITETTDDPYIITDITAGTYELTEMSDAFFNAIEFSSKAIITQNSLPTSEITSGDTEICTGTNTAININLTGEAPWSLTINDGTSSTTVNKIETSPYSFNATDSGIYTVTTLKDKDGCQATTMTGSATITENALPTSIIKSGDVTICATQNTDIEIEFTGVAPWTFTHSIDGIDQTPIVTSDNPYFLTTSTGGLYEITALTDASETGVCFSGSTTITALASVIPESNIISPDTAICQGERYDIDIELTGEAPWNLTYKIGTSSYTIEDITTNVYTIPAYRKGLYTITALTGNGCIGSNFTGSTQLTVNTLPSVNLGEDISFCEGDSTTIDAGIFSSYLWNDGSIEQTNTVNNTGTYSVTVTNSNGCKDSDEINVTVNPLPTVSLGSDITMCQGETTTLAVGTYSTYLWSNGSTNPIIEVSSEGVYDVSITNTFGCKGFDTINVYTTTLPTSNIIESEITICEGETAEINIDLTGTPPWDLTYTIDDTNPVTITNITSSPYKLKTTEAGLYKVTSLISNNCEGTDLSGSTQIIVNPLPSSTFLVGNESFTLCENESMDFELQFTGEGPWTYEYEIEGQSFEPITTSENTAIITADKAGIYDVVSITDLNCTNIHNNGFPEIWYNELATASITSLNQTICDGSIAQITVELTGTAPWSFTYTKDGLDPKVITTSESNYILNVYEAGLYVVDAVSDAYGSGTCITGSSSVNVNTLPIPNLGLDLEICQGNSVTLDAGNFASYLWSNDSETQTIVVNSTGNYSVEVTDINGCKNTDEITVTVNALPIVDLGTQQEICEGSFVTLDAGSFDSYLWSNGNETQTIDAYTAGTYSVEVTDFNGCKNTDDVIVTVNVLPVVNLGTDQEICEGSSVTLDAGSFASYLWSDDSESQTIDVNSTGTYSVEVTDVNGCKNTDQVFVNVNPLPVSDFTFTENVLEVTFTNTSINSDSYLWNFGDSNTSSEENPVHTYAASGTYDVVLKASNANCGDSLLTKTVNIVGTSIENMELKDMLTIYPNPSNGLISIEFTKKELKRVNIYIVNSSGNRVFENSIELINNKQKLNLSNLPAGIYSVIIYTEDFELTRNIIITK